MPHVTHEILVGELIEQLAGLGPLRGSVQHAVGPVRAALRDLLEPAVDPRVVVAREHAQLDLLGNPVRRERSIGIGIERPQAAIAPERRARERVEVQRLAEQNRVVAVEAQLHQVPRPQILSRGAAGANAAVADDVSVGQREPVIRVVEHADVAVRPGRLHA